MIFNKKTANKISATLALATWFAGAMLVLLCSAANAQYADMLYSPNQSQQSLRNPLVPGASYAAPGQPAGAGMPPPIGNGPVPAAEIPGDLGAPALPRSGMADPTHGNIFPAMPGQAAPGPWEYVPGAGRRVTTNGIDQGVFDYGKEQTGTMWGPGGQNMGLGIMNNPGARMGAQGMGPGGQEGGQNVQNDGGPRGGASGMGSGGENGGQRWGPGGEENGTKIENNGGPRGGAGKYGPGSEENGSKVVNNGGPRGGADKNGNGGEMEGTKIINNGGPAPGADKSGDRIFQHAQQPNRYDFNGPLPTVRTFCRYLVILGAVFGTVFVAMAAFSMVYGSPYGGQRVIGAAGGLILLFMGYTIWKIVEMNTFHANSTGQQNNSRGNFNQNQHNGPYTIQNGPNGGPFEAPQEAGYKGNNDHRGPNGPTINNNHTAGNGQTINAAQHGPGMLQGLGSGGGQAGFGPPSNIPGGF